MARVEINLTKEYWCAQDGFRTTDMAAIGVHLREHRDARTPADGRWQNATDRFAVKILGPVILLRMK